MSEKQITEKEARRRARHSKKNRLLEVFRQTLLQRNNEQIKDTIIGWMNPLIFEHQELGDFIESELDNVCETLGFRIATNTIETKVYASYSAWRDSEDEEQEHGAEFVHDDLSSLRHRIESLTIKEVENLAGIAFLALDVEARDDGRPHPPQFPKFIEYVTKLILPQSEE